jgi:hypothetical protein
MHHSKEPSGLEWIAGVSKTTSPHSPKTKAGLGFSPRPLRHNAMHARGNPSIKSAGGHAQLRCARALAHGERRRGRGLRPSMRQKAGHAVASAAFAGPAFTDK